MVMVNGDDLGKKKDKTKKQRDCEQVDFKLNESSDDAASLDPTGPGGSGSGSESAKQTALS